MERSQHSPRPASPIGPLTIVGILADLPNAITFIGAVLSMTAITLVLAGSNGAALCFALWSHLADSLDGYTARRMTGRAGAMAQMGKMMDTLADFLAAAVFPLILLIRVADFSPLSLGSGMLICGAGILRLSYFDAVGLDRGRFVGVPLPHNIPVFALAYLLAQSALPAALPVILPIAAIAMAALHLSPLRIPKFSEKMIAISAIGFAIMTCLLLL
jgi:CDP-diacylglycerol---serine O-phosphatidyltransferase